LLKLARVGRANLPLALGGSVLADARAWGWPHAGLAWGESLLRPRPIAV